MEAAHGPSILRTPPDVVATVLLKHSGRGCGRGQQPRQLHVSRCSLRSSGTAAAHGSSICSIVVLSAAAHRRLDRQQLGRPPRGVAFGARTLARQPIALRGLGRSGVTSPFGELPYSQKIAEFLRKPEAALFEAALIAMACVVYAFGTLELNAATSAVLSDLEQGIQIIFLLEYLLRWYSSSCSPSCLLELYMVVDALAFLPLVLQLLGVAEIAPLEFLRILRILRLQRFLQDPESFGQLIGRNAADVRPLDLELARAVLSISTLLFVSSGLMYNVEHGVNPGFPNLFQSLYFGLVTLTTVGYGDIVPLTLEGRTIVCLSILVAIPLIPFNLTRVVEAFFFDNVSQKAPVSNPELEKFQKQLDANQEQLKELSRRFEAAGLDASTVTCSACFETDHRVDARFCFKCGAALPVLMVDASSRTVAEQELRNNINKEIAAQRAALILFPCLPL